MEAVLKIGGSLSENPDNLTLLCQKLSYLAKKHRILVIPGGGKFADIVRQFDETYRISDKITHKMAILAMDQYGLFLSDITPNSYIIQDPRKTKSTNGILPIFLPSKFMFKKDPLQPSWNVTSDSISAYIADLLGAKKLILVTDVDGIFFQNPKKKLNSEHIKEMSARELLDWNKRTSVDKTLPIILMETNLDCYVVNGIFPERIQLILENKKPVCTHIVA